MKDLKTERHAVLAKKLRTVGLSSAEFAEYCELDDWIKLAPLRAKMKPVGEVKPRPVRKLFFD